MNPAEPDLHQTYTDKTTLNFYKGSNITGNISVIVDSTAKPTKIWRQAAEAISKPLIKIYRDELDNHPKITIPVFFNNKASDSRPLKKYNFLKRSWFIGNFSSTFYKDYVVWLIPIATDRQQKYQEIATELRADHWRLRQNKRIYFIQYDADCRSTKAITIYLPPIIKPAKNCYSNIPQFKTGYGVLVFTNQTGRRNYTIEDAAKFRKLDFRTYLQYVNYYAMNKTTLFALAQRIINLPNVEYTELARLYQNLAIKKFAPETRQLRQKLLLQMGQILKQKQQPSSNWLSKLNSFIGLLKKVKTVSSRTFYQHPAFAPFKKNIIIAPLTKVNEHSYKSKLKQLKLDELKIIIPEYSSSAIADKTTFLFIIQPNSVATVNKGCSPIKDIIETSSNKSLQKLQQNGKSHHKTKIVKNNNHQQPILAAHCYSKWGGMNSRARLQDKTTQYFNLDNGSSSSGTIKHQGNDLRIMAMPLSYVLKRSGITLIITYNSQNNKVEYQLFLKKKRTKLGSPR